MVEACETLVQPSHKTLDEVQKSRVKERMQELKIQQMAPEKELPLPLFEHAGHRDTVDAHVVNHAYPGLHAGTHIPGLFKAAVRLPNSENFDVWMIKFHKAARMLPGVRATTLDFACAARPSWPRRRTSPSS